MTSIEKLQALYTGARALQLAVASGMITDANELPVYQGFVDALLNNVGQYLLLAGMLPPEGAVVAGVYELSRL